MAKETFTRTKPHVNVGTIGHIDHGKTTLTAAILAVQAAQGPGQGEGLRRHRQGRHRPRRQQDGDHRRLARRVREREAALRPHRLPGPRRLHQEHDHRRRPDGRGDPGGRRPPTARCRRPASTSCWPARSACPAIVVFLNKIDLVDDPELLELVEMELRELLTKYKFPGDEIPIIRGSSRPALENPDRRQGRQADRRPGQGAGRVHPRAGPRRSTSRS